MRGGRNRQQLSDALYDAEDGDLGITQRHETSVDPAYADVGHYYEPFLIRTALLQGTCFSASCYHFFTAFLDESVTYTAILAAARGATENA
jgi:hypothetical protein